MTRSRRKLRRCLLAVGCLFLLGGCGTVSLEPVLVREPRPEEIPVVIGVHYSTEFRTLVYRKTTGQRTLSAFAVGAASVRVFDEALSLLFKGAVQVPDRVPPAGRQSAVAGVIEPTITAVSYWVPQGGVSVNPVRARAEITYTLTLYSPQGLRLADWEVRGDGVDVADGAGVEISGAGSAVARSLEMAMREAAWNLVTHFRDAPGVPAWLAGQGVH